MRLADRMDDERLVAVLEVVIAPAAPGGNELCRDQRRVARGRRVVLGRRGEQRSTRLKGARCPQPRCPHASTVGPPPDNSPDDAPMRRFNACLSLVPCLSLAGILKAEPTVTP